MTRRLRPIEGAFGLFFFGRSRLLGITLLLLLSTACNPLKGARMNETEAAFRTTATPQTGGEGANPNLKCSLKIEVGKALKIHARLENPGDEGIYIFNRLWHMEASKRPAEDPEKMYRFIRDSELRLLLGPAPLPRLKTVTYKNIPYATLIKPHGILDLEQSLNLPAEEYSAYFPTSPGTPPAPVNINLVTLSVVWVEAREAHKTSPSPFAPDAVKIEVPGVLDHARYAGCGVRSASFEGLRRTDEFDRLTLHGESPEPLQISH